MSDIYDNWERLVEAVLKREHLREIALQDSTSLSSSMSSDFSPGLSSNVPTLDGTSSHQHDLTNSAIDSSVESRKERPWKDEIVPIKSSFPWNVLQMLDAKAERLGVGTLGSTYKVMLDERTTVIVKRMRKVKMTRQEFEQQIQSLGSIEHVNIVATIAQFFYRETHCLIFDYCKQSLASMLHDEAGKNSRPLDWDTRLRIAIGTARGLAHIHAECGGKLVHGHVKASNIFLNSEGDGCISDHGLVTIGKVNELSPLKNRGYLAPEITNCRQVSQEADVYSYGVVLLELLTRKLPDVARLGKKAVGLVRWVNDVVSKKGTSKVFDSKLVKNPFVEEDMVKMLLLGMHCVATKPEQRPKMADILKMMECWKR